MQSITIRFSPTAQREFCLPVARTHYQQMNVKIPEGEKVFLMDGQPSIARKVTDIRDPLFGFVEIVTVANAVQRGMLVATPA